MVEDVRYYISCVGSEANINGLTATGSFSTFVKVNQGF
jgi:hypothetical protein